jgi:predicted ATPase
MTQPVFSEIKNLLNFLQIPILGDCICIAGWYLQDLLERVISIGPYRNPPSRWYYQANDQSLQSETNGTSIPAYLFENPKIVKETNRFLKALEIQYSIAPRSLGNQESGLFELRLRDLYRKKSVYVGLSDVGYGLSQILPVVVESIAASHRIILIEQPELHIHPKLQADLADMFIYGCGEYNNQYILETHSEHLMLRLLRRVREGKISPEMLSVIYVSRGPFGSVVHSVRIDKNGDFMDDFPGGFFPERLDELL